MKNKLTISLIILNWLAGLGLLFNLLGSLHWIFDITTYFTLFFLTITIFCSTYLMTKCKWLHAIPLLIGVIVVVFCFKPFYKGEASTNQANLKLATFNVGQNPNTYDPLIQYLKTTDRDIVLLIEIREDLQQRIENELAEIYPYREITPSRMTLGLAYLSKIPFDEVETKQLFERRRYLHGTVSINNRQVDLVSVHPLPPTRINWAANKETELLALQNKASESGNPSILFGDFNSVPWSGSTKSLYNENWKFADTGNGLQSSFFVLGGLLRFPLDYAIVTDDIEIVSYKKGPNLESDHLPIEFDLFIP